MKFYSMQQRKPLLNFACGIILFFTVINQAFSLPKIETWVNPDKVPVYFVHSPEPPMLDIHLIFKAGAVHENVQGLASMTAAMLKHGSRGMDVEQTNEAIDSLGTIISTSGGAASININIRTLTDHKHLEKSLALLIRILSSPTFPKDQLDFLKKKRLLVLHTQNDRPDKIISRVIRETVYTDHPYSLDIIGTEASLAIMTTEHLKTFYRTYVGTANMLITAVGAISKDDITNITNRITAAIGKGQKAAPVPKVPPLKTSLIEKIAFPSQQAHIKMAQPFIETGHPDFFKLRLGNHILGGSGFGSKIMSEIRVKQGLAYSAYSAFITRLGGGIFFASLQTRADQADQAVDILKNLIKTFVSQGPSSEEVKLAYDNIRGGFALGLDSNSKIHNSLDQIAFHNLGTDYLDKYLSHFETITPDDIVEAFQRHLYPNKMVTVIVGGNDNPE